MTAHELQYCRYLLQCMKDLYIERAALTTILDMPKSSSNSPASESAADWRPLKEKMAGDPVFRSAVEANFAPVFERMKNALTDERAFAAMVAAGVSAAPSASTD